MSLLDPWRRQQHLQGDRQHQNGHGGAPAPALPRDLAAERDNDGDRQDGEGTQRVDRQSHSGRGQQHQGKPPPSLPAL